MGCGGGDPLDLKKVWSGSKLDRLQLGKERRSRSCPFNVDPDKEGATPEFRHPPTWVRNSSTRCARKVVTLIPCICRRLDESNRCLNEDFDSKTVSATPHFPWKPNASAELEEGAIGPLLELKSGDWEPIFCKRDDACSSQPESICCTRSPTSTMPIHTHMVPNALDPNPISLPRLTYSRSNPLQPLHRPPLYTLIRLHQFLKGSSPIQYLSPL